jgi:ketosteroid isomerase-like protein
MNRDIQDELMALATDWDRAMVENDAEAIGRYVADDWTIIGSDGHLGTGRPFWDL